MLLLSSALTADAYELGEGLQVATLPIYIGGYISADYRYLDEDSRYRFDDIALLSYGSYDDFSYMAEGEFKGFYSETYSQESKRIEKDTKLYLERLYVDYSSNSNTLRLGKYNTPIGLWNLIPINVLRDTSSNPISNEVLYPKYSTGLGDEYLYFGKGEISLNVIVQYNEGFDDSYNNFKVDQHFGLGLGYEIEDTLIKMNIGYFHQTELLEDENTYALLSFKYERNDYKISSEIGTQYSKNASDFSYAGYLQGLYNFTEQHIGIVRFEGVKNSALLEDDAMAIFAYTYRPFYAMAIKSEYQLHSKEDNNQFIFSFSVLF